MNSPSSSTSASISPACCSSYFCPVVKNKQEVNVPGNHRLNIPVVATLQ